MAARTRDTVITYHQVKQERADVSSRRIVPNFFLCVYCVGMQKGQFSSVLALSAYRSKESGNRFQNSHLARYSVGVDDLFRDVS